MFSVLICYINLCSIECANAIRRELVGGHIAQSPGIDIAVHRWSQMGRQSHQSYTTSMNIHYIEISH